MHGHTNVKKFSLQMGYIVSEYRAESMQLTTTLMS